jgi:hypothetical protein
LRSALAALRRVVSGAARRGGLVVDLTGVTHLAAAGVQLLHDLAAEEPGLRFVAPPDRPAHAVLRLAGLADRTIPAP